jgi:threonine dehydrogenase-like Zn-dependent dehydrogenase
VYHGPGKRCWDERPKPAVQDVTDAVVKIERTTICGTDLHIMKGDVATVTSGRTLGYEGVGIVDEVGSGVMNFKKWVEIHGPLSRQDSGCFASARVLGWTESTRGREAKRTERVNNLSHPRLVRGL